MNKKVAAISGLVIAGLIGGALVFSNKGIKKLHLKQMKQLR